MTTISPEHLLAHSGWIRPLCRSLVRDPHLAEDVVQETWMAALRHGPRKPAALRKWLRTVATNFARQALRREGMRETQILAPDETGTTADPSEATARAEFRKHLVEAVLALNEPYRSTVILHYFEEMSIEAVAHGQEVPASTVRTRLRRALALLQRSLEGEYQNTWQSWAIAIASTGRPTGRTLPAGAAPGIAWPVKTVAAVLLVGGAAWLGWHAFAADPTPGEESAAQFAATHPNASAAIPGADPSSLRGSGAAATSRTAVSGDEEASEGSAESVVRGRLLLEGGAPVVGYRVVLDGRESDDELVRQYGRPENWTDPEVLTDEEGRFEIRFEPHPAHAFHMSVKRDGYARERWSWLEIRPGMTEELGEITLLRGGDLEGRLVDEAGNAVTGMRWTMHARELTFGARRPRQSVLESVLLDRATGTFRFEDLPPGPIRLRAQSSQTPNIDGPTPTVVAGETISVVLVYDRTLVAGRIVVKPFSRPFAGMPTVIDPPFLLHGAGPEPLVAQRTGSRASDPEFADVPPGTYTIEVDHPAFRPWREEGVAPGSAVHAVLEGSSALMLRVVPAGSEEPVDHYATRIAFRNVNFYPREFDMHDEGDEPSNDLLEGMFPGDYQVTITSAEYGVGYAEVDALQAGETREVTVSLGGSLSLEGRVVFPDGEPAVQMDVRLVTPAEVDDSPTSSILPRNGRAFPGDRLRREVGATKTDEEGRFLFDLPRPGHYAVQARWGLGLTVGSEAAHVPEGEVRLADLVIGRGAIIQGQIVAPEGRSCAGLLVNAVPHRTTNEDFFAMRAGRRTRVTLPEDGTFELGPFPPGETELYLLLPVANSRGISFGSMDHRSPGIPLGTVPLVEGETTTPEYEPGPRFPAEVSIRLVPVSQPIETVDLRLDYCDESVRIDPVEVLVGEDGRTRSMKLFGGPWTVRLDSADEGWAVTLPTPLTVAGGQTGEIELPVELARAAVGVVDADTGAAIVDRRLAVVRQDAFSHVVTTDAEGRVDLTLISGTYTLVLLPPEAGRGFRVWRTLADIPAEDGRMATIVWTSEGPGTEVIGL